MVIRTLLIHTYVTISDNTKNNIFEQSKIHYHHHQNLHQVHYHYQFPSVLCFPYFHIGIILCIVNPFSYMSTSWCCSLSAPSPDEYGWTIEATYLDIKWGPMESTPDSILEIICNVQVQERLQHQEVLM